jgi:transposase-like protein
MASETTPRPTAPKGLQAAIRYFSDPKRCLDYVVSRRWPNGVKCPTCGATKVHFLANQLRWKCSAKHAKRQFSAKVGTIFEDSPIGFDKWLPAMWLIANCKNGISSYEIGRHLQVTQKTAWFMLQRIRLAMQSRDGGKLGGPGRTVECDETWIGGKARSMNRGRRGKTSTNVPGKTKKRGPYAVSGKAIVMGMLERGGRVRLQVVPDVKGKTLRPIVRANVEKGSELHTDELQSYTQLDQPIPGDLGDGVTMGEYPTDYTHKVVNHAVEYVNGNVHTNNMENFWSLLKRGLRGTYISVEPFHLFRYVDEQAFRFNERKHEDGDAGRFAMVVDAVAGRRLTYKQLTAQPGS